MPGELGVLRRGAAAEVVKRQPETPAEVCLDLVLLRAVRVDTEAGLGRRELGRRAVFVGGADEEDVVPAQPQVARVHVGGQHASRPGCQGA